MQSDKRVDELCRKWQEILQLRDWDIHVELFSAREFSEEDRKGEVFYDISAEQAILHLPDVDADRIHGFLMIWKKLLVHEGGRIKWKEGMDIVHFCRRLHI